MANDFVALEFFFSKLKFLEVFSTTGNLFTEKFKFSNKEINFCTKKKS